MPSKGRNATSSCTASPAATGAARSASCRERSAEPAVDDVQVWRDWLAGRGFRDIEPRRLPNRVLRASLPAAAFGKGLEWWRLGSFETQKRTFLQFWCDDELTRLWAVLVRAGNQVSRCGLRDIEALERRLAELSRQLQVSTPQIKTFRRTPARSPTTH